MDENSGFSGDYKDELFRMNCVEISSESDPKYTEHSILLVDNILEDDQRQEYEDYIFYGRDGMPSWRDYYAIKNLIETLQEIDELTNQDTIDLIKKVEESFIGTLYGRLFIDKDCLSRYTKSILFPILQKLEFFFPKDDRLLLFLLKVDNGEIEKKDIIAAQKQVKEIFKDDNYFQYNEKLFIELCLIYFNDDGKKLFKQRINDVEDENLNDRLPELLSAVSIS